MLEAPLPSQRIRRLAAAPEERQRQQQQHRQQLQQARPGVALLVGGRLLRVLLLRVCLAAGRAAVLAVHLGAWVEGGAPAAGTALEV